MLKQVEVETIPVDPTKEDRVRVSIDTNNAFKIALFNKARIDGTDVNKLTRQFWKMYLDGKFQFEQES